MPTPSFVQKNVGTDGSAGATCTVTIAAGGNGNIIMGIVGFSDNVTISNVKDNNGTTYNLVDSVHDLGNSRWATTFYKENVSGGPTSVIASFSGSATDCRIEVNEWSNVATSTPLDGHTMQTTSGTTLSTGSIVTGTNGDLIYGACFSVVSDDTYSVGGGYQIRNNDSGSGIVNPIADETQIQALAGSISATFGASPSGFAIAGIMAFLASLGVAPTTEGIVGFVESDW